MPFCRAALCAIAHWGGASSTPWPLGSISAAAAYGTARSRLRQGYAAAHRGARRAEASAKAASRAMTPVHGARDSGFGLRPPRNDGQILDYASLPPYTSAAPCKDERISPGGAQNGGRTRWGIEKGILTCLAAAN